jgi:hypothetical protein
MKNLFTIIGLILISVSISYAQDLHTPSEIESIMKKSLSYYEEKEDTNFMVVKSLDIISNDYYFAENEEGERVLLQYNMAENTQLYQPFQRALKYHAVGKYKKERKILQALYKNHSNNALIMTQLANSFLKEGEYTNAKSWAHKAIRANPIHSPAHVLVARTLIVGNQLEKAMEAITKAHLYNRNDRQVIALLKEIYLLNGRVYDDTWAFIPQCETTKVAANKISIKYNGEPWRAFAACNAVWEYEPYYRQKMEITGNDLELMRYHEALMNLGIAFEGWDNKKRKNKFYMGDAIKVAVEKNLVREFLDYEMEYLENPKAALYLTYDDIKVLSKYLLEVRALQEFSRKEIIEDNRKMIDEN